MNEQDANVVAGGQPIETPANPETQTETATPAEGRTQVPTADFINAWVEVQHELTLGKIKGRGVDIVAERLGLVPNSVDQRKNNINKKLKAASKPTLPKMPSAAGNRFNVDVAASVLEKAIHKYDAPVGG